MYHGILFILSFVTTLSEPGGCYAKESKSDQERQVVHGITYVCNLKKKVELLETRSGKTVIRGWGWG